MSATASEPALYLKANPNCKECGGLGTVRHYIGHEGRGAIFPCKCTKDKK